LAQKGKKEKGLHPRGGWSPFLTTATDNRG
jgi:hypothetical protein